MPASAKTAVTAWATTGAFYLYQYALSAAPEGMLPQLSQAFGLTPLGVASMTGLFFFSYALCSLVAGVAINLLSPERVLPAAAAFAGAGALLFAIPNNEVASIGRLMQGAGGAFALVGAVSIAATCVAASRVATAIGAIQMLGVVGGLAGHWLMGRAVDTGVLWSYCWLGLGVAGFAVAALQLRTLPRGVGFVPTTSVPQQASYLSAARSALSTVLRNPQSLLCGAIAGLLLFPMTIFTSLWSVQYLQDARGFDEAAAIVRSTMTPLGWAIGCPLLGALSDAIGRRKPVLIGGALILLGSLALVFYGPAGLLPPYVLALLVGIASGAAMLAYVVVTETNPRSLSGTAVGAINFVAVTLSALLAPLFGWILATHGRGTFPLQLEHYQTTFKPLLYGVGIAAVLALLLKETGGRIRHAEPSVAEIQT